jgi:hypothetical protein
MRTKPRPRAIILAVLICIVAGLIGLFSWPYLAMWERSVEIDMELTHLPDHDWAGHYVGQCWDLSLAPNSGFAVEFLPPFHHSSAPDYGSVEQHGDEIQLNWRGGLNSRFRIVRWGKRRYLIQPIKLLPFCVEIRADGEIGGEPRTKQNGWYLLRVGDEQIPVTGYPDLPSPYQTFLRLKTIKATVKSIDQAWLDERKERRFLVSLNGGTADGILPDLCLSLGDSSDLSGQITVKTASPHESRAEAYVRRGELRVGQTIEWPWPPR